MITTREVVVAAAFIGAVVVGISIVLGMMFTARAMTDRQFWTVVGVIVAIINGGFGLIFVGAWVVWRFLR